MSKRKKKADAKPTIESPSVVHEGPLKYCVSLANLPSVEFEAADEAEAWAKYKAYNGILDTIHQPTINLVVDEPEPEPDEEEQGAAEHLTDPGEDDDGNGPGADPDDQVDDSGEDGGDSGEPPADV